MPRTTFQNGTIVSPEWLNSHYVTGGGHVHDGVNEDGHCRKIELEAEVTGKLPAARISYNTDVATIELEGFAAPVNMLLRWIKKPIADGLVETTLVIPTVLGISSSSYLRAAQLSKLPQTLRPVDEIAVPFLAVNNNTTNWGICIIYPDGNIVFAPSTQFASWSDTGNKGFGPFTVRYFIEN